MDRHSERVTWATDPSGWWVSGIPLQRVAYRIHEVSALGPPALRGPDIQTAGEPGSRWRPKIHASRSVALAFWLIPSSDGPLEGAFRDLWLILGKHHSLTTVERRVEVDDRVEQVEAQAQVVDRPETALFGLGHYADIAIDLHLPDPYWYLPSRTKTISAGGSTHRVWNPGTVERHFDPTVTLNGPLTNPRLTNTTLDVWVEYDGTIADGDTVTLDSREMTAVDDGGSSVAADVSKSGTWWMEMASERNEFELTADSGDGDAKVEWRPALL